MYKIKIVPLNKEYFIRLKEFGKNILDILCDLRVTPIAYGSLTYFGYMKDKNIAVNDIDLLIPENSFKKIIKILEEKNIRYNYSAEWHTLQVFDGNLKIEFDSIDFWQKDLPKDFEEFDFDGLVVKAVSLNSLRRIYKKASETSKDNPHGNLKKYEALKKLG